LLSELRATISESTRRTSARRVQVGEIISMIVFGCMTIMDVEEEPWHAPYRLDWTETNISGLTAPRL
jgi:hypothetical protein